MHRRLVMVIAGIGSLVVACLAAATLVGSEPAGARSAVRAYQPVHRGGTLRILAQASAGSLDPQVNDSPQYWQIFPAVYDGLVAFTQASGPASVDLVPDLARSLPSVADGGRTYVFTLRRGIRFSTGALVSPDDVAASLRRIFRVGAPTAASTYRGIVGADACLEVPTTCTLAGGVVADGRAGTVTIRLVAPDPDFLMKLATPPAAVLPAGTPTPGGNLPPAGTGAYRVSSYDPAAALVLERNPFFVEWNRAAQPAGYPDRIVESFGQDPSAMLTAVERGQADASFDEPPAGRWPELMTPAYAGRVHVNALTADWYLAMNVRVAPFDHLAARQAVNWAVDRAAVARLFGGPALAVPACTVLPPGIPGHRDQCPYSKLPGGSWQGPDLVRARRLVAESATAGQRVRVVVADDPVSRAIGENVAASLRAIGYRATSRPVPAALEYEYVQNPDNEVQISLTNWFQDYPSPADFLPVLLGCPAVGRATAQASPNLSGYCDPAIEARMDRASADGAATTATAGAWADLDRDVSVAAPIAPLITPSHADVLGRRVGNYQWSQQYRMILSQLWVR